MVDHIAMSGDAQALFINMGSYLQGLFSLAHDSSAEVRKLVCANFVFPQSIVTDY